MFGCSKIKYVKPSPVTYHLSSVTCLILQPWLGLGTWFLWQWVLKRSTCGADRHVIAWLVFLLLFSTDFFSLQHWYFLSPSIWFIEVWDERSWATFWTASSGAMCISHLMWLGIALHVHCHRLFIWCALMCIHCHRLFPDSSKVRGFARSNPAKSVKRGGQILDGEVQIFLSDMCGMKFILCDMKFILLFKLFLQVQDMLMEQKEIIACALYVVECAKILKYHHKMTWVVFLLTCHFACMGTACVCVKQWFQNQTWWCDWIVWDTDPIRCP